MGQESNLVTHARKELELLGEEPEIIDGLLRVVQAYADMNHSGGSHSVCLPMLTALLDFKNLKPLTDDPDEWIHISDDMAGRPDLWQNTRNYECFSHDGGKTYYKLSDPKTVTGKWLPIHKSEKSGKQ